MNESLHRETRDRAIQQTRDRLEKVQLERLNRLLDEVVPRHAFYRHKLAGLRWPLTSLDDLDQIPFTTKSELSRQAIENPPSLLTYPMAEYSRVHRTSGSIGRPIYVFDTRNDWQWWIDTWQFVLDAADVTPRDHALMAFSFGPFIGFWSAYDALVQRGAMVVPTGGMSSRGRLECLVETQATVVCCTPTYALRLAEIAGDGGIDLAGSPVRALIVAGEPGGSIPSIRDRLESLWGAKVIDHAGASELGPWGFADREGAGLRVVETEFIAEFLPVAIDAPFPDRAHGASASVTTNGLAELVLTPLGRFGFPLMRYRTGDLVRMPIDASRPLSVDPLPSGSNGQTVRSREDGFVRMPGGILGRADDMLTVRGVNIFPAAIEAIIRSAGSDAEYQVDLDRTRALEELRIEIEATSSQAEAIADELHVQLGLRVRVVDVPPGSLPRFEGKARRIPRRG